ncbi:MAG: V-type H+-transporting ATPase subunit A [Parcubacteria group bacterium LiPW_72]|nr:MAG: V-type H+-transporting ATPase subunit A [Parcubacteria group bacterium LiPW_72]
MSNLENKQGIIVKVSGPLVIAEGIPNARMFDVVKVGEKKLIGEIIGLNQNQASIQVYEDTAGVGPGELVETTGRPLSVELGPGMIKAIYDGIQRPLDLIFAKSGAFIARGMEAPGVDREKEWDFKPVKKEGDVVEEGDILGTVQETSLIMHKIMVPPGAGGKITAIKAGQFKVEDIVAKIKTAQGEQEIAMLQRWPIRIPRPVKQNLPIDTLMASGQRVIDTFFPLAQGGTACVPGPFGSGKTVVQHQLAKWADAEIIVFIGCGERGNEMTDVLIEFPELKDPKSGRPLMERTILIANTSNMPVAAREASIYTGITIAEYYRDMGYKVALTADSTSRWAEALREMSGRLEEMPGEEGYPAYLGTRTAAFYERAGRVECLGSEKRIGSLSVIGAVSPPGGDFSEPVTQNTLRVTKVFWALDSALAYKRHFPAINWLTSYSLYTENLEEYFRNNVAADFNQYRQRAMKILQEEANLEEIVRLVGFDALGARDQLILRVARMVREDFLHQNAFDEIDTYTSLPKQYGMLKIIIDFYDLVLSKVKELDLKELFKQEIIEDIARLKFIPEDKIQEEYPKVWEKIEKVV